MSFYQELSRYYDEIFAVDEKEMRFIAGLFTDCRKILDLGCGTGNKTVYLAGPGKSVTGIDLDKGMIARAADAGRENGIRYETANMLDVDSLFPGASFDGVACLGNTLVHLSAGDIRLLFEKIHALLDENGLLVIQILNYDRILDKDVRSLPDIDTPRVAFTREYSRVPEGLRFKTAIRLKNNGQMFRNDVLLHPLRREELADLLAGTGFGTPGWFGSYQGDPLLPDSFVTIAACRKLI